MKKLLAVLLAVAMLFSVAAFNTSAAEDPKVTIITNEGSSLVVGDDAYFTVRFDNFTTIKGMDVDVAVTNASNLKLERATGFTFELAENENYKINGTALKLVDLTGQEDGKLIFKVESDAAAPVVTVTGKYAKSGSELTNVADASATLDVVTKLEPEKTETTPTENTTLAQPEGDTFIPYGSVVNAEGKFVTKNENGSFTLDANKAYTYSTFTKPSADVGLTTYGVTNEKDNANNLRFGTYSILNTESYTHGTLVFEGDWIALKNYYIQNGYTVQEFVKAIYKNAKEHIGDYSFVRYTIPNAGTINVYVVDQTKVMWTDGTNLEYGVRINGAKPNTTYAAIAYSYSGDDIRISDNARYITTAASAS